jgi:hypothetical protein
MLELGSGRDESFDSDVVYLVPELFDGDAFSIFDEFKD